MMDLKKTLRALSQSPGPSGWEGPAVFTAQEFLRPLADDVFMDRLGNLLGVIRCGKPNAKKLLLDAHLDEVSLIVTGIQDGFLRFAAIGGIDPRLLPAREVLVLTEPEPVFGVVACLPPHLQTAEDEEKAVEIQDLRIDVGMTQEMAEQSIPIGTPIVYRQACSTLGNGQFFGKALDDRSCFTVLLRTAELLRENMDALDVDVWIMGSVQEERAGGGALVGTRQVQPDWCIAIDVTFGSTADTSLDETSCVVSKGPAIGTGPNMTPWMTQRMIAKAKERSIPYQMEVMEGSSGTNGWEMQTCLEGIPTSLVSLPLKYMHTPIEVISLDDIEHTAELLAAFAEHLGQEGL